MKESTAVLIWTTVFIILGIIALIFVFFSAKFNFYETRLTIINDNVAEQLKFSPDKPYHTLFRTFVSPIYTNLSYTIQKNSLVITDVQCSSGTPYINTNFDCNDLYSEKITNNCLPYTEKNEIGCTFGNTLGFQKASEETIDITYTLKPENLFLIGGNYYIKFIAYSKNNHKFLVKDKDFFINKGVAKNFYLPSEDVIIYVPFKPDNLQDYKILTQKSFLFEKSSNYFFLILFAFFPALLFFFVWLFFGRDRWSFKVPESLSMYPKNRKPWEVAAFFSPSESGGSMNALFSSTLLDFYKRKIISLKIKKDDFLSSNDTYIKINDMFDESRLDEIEQNILAILKKLRDSKDKDEIQNGYFSLKIKPKAVFSGFSASKKRTDDIKNLREKYLDLSRKISIKSKKYKSGTGMALLISLSLLFCFATIWILQEIFILALAIISFLLMILIAGKSMIIYRYKGDYYEEYQEWKAFKKYLSDSESIKTSDSKALVLWGEFLVYATALGVSEKVLKNLKEKGFISEDQYVFYIGITHSGNSFYSGTLNPSSGGFGGAGGGGVGGGGGGGR